MFGLRNVTKVEMCSKNTRTDGVFWAIKYKLIHIRVSKQEKLIRFMFLISISRLSLFFYRLFIPYKYLK